MISRKNKRAKINQKFALIGVFLIAVIVTVSLSIPSITSLPEQTMQPVDTKLHFNLDIAYAYVGQGPPNASYVAPNGCLMSPESEYPSAVYFNVTRSANAESETCDALIDVYIVKIASDKGPTETYAYFDGTNFSPSFSDADLNILTQHIYDLINIDTVDGVSGNFCFNWTATQSVLSQKVGSIGSYSNFKSGLGLWRGGQPNLISVTVNQLGYVTITNGVITVHANAMTSNNLTQVQLQQYGNNFINNKLVAMDKLSQIDLFHPVG